jgi:FkbM family methyltransferase
MASRHIGSLFSKSWPERYRTAKFYFRQGLSKLPYLPVPVRLEISAAESIEFWWSRLVPYHDDRRGFLDYWGHDAGDLRFLWKVLRPGMTFIDIGANQGIYSLVAGKKLRTCGSVVAFEPSLREHQRLELHFRWNGMSSPSARAERLALSATASARTFFQVASGDTSRNGFRAPATSDPVNEITVESTTLDEYVSAGELTNLDVIKVDVEGGELDVLRGARRAISRFRPIFICEVLDAATGPWGYPAREIVSALAAQDYSWFDVNDEGSLAPHQAQREYPRIENYVAIPNERSTAICAESRV